MKVDARCAQLAAGQWGILDLDDLRACGLTQQAVSKRVAAGRLFALYRGVFAYANPKLELEGCFLAAVKACGPDAVLSHFSAAALHGIVEWDYRDPEVTAPTPRRHKGIRTHRSASIERVYRKGIPVTPIVRTLIDLAAILRYKPLRRAVNEAFNKGLIKPSDLLATNHRGARKLRRILATAAPTRNDFEDIMRAIADEYDLPTPAVNQPLLGYVPDFRWSAQRVIVETDGARTHGHILARTDDAERQAILEAHGETVLRVTWFQATMQPARTAKRIRDALAGYSGKPHMISTNQFKNGNHIEVEGTVFKIIEFQHVKPGKGGAFVRTKLRRTADGNVIDRTFRAGEKFRPIHTEARKMQFLYADGTDAHFMDEESYEQIALPETSMAEPLKWIRPNETVDMLYIDGNPADIQLTASVELEVTHTEPGVRGDTASGGGNKPATLETGAIVNVPLFVNIGDRVKVDTRSGNYMSRA